MEVFKDYAYYYNEFYHDKDYVKETEDISKLLQKYTADIYNIIDFGCGTGKHAVELAKMGYCCEGIDISPLMIKMARQNAERENLNVKFSVSRIQDFTPQKRYDAVVSLFHVMSYQCNTSDLITAFKVVRESLKLGGIFLFDAWYGPGVLSDKPATRVKQIENDYEKLIRIAKPNMDDKRNMVKVNYDILVIDKKTGVTKEINEGHDMRYFFRPEIELMLHEVGLELIDNFDCNTFGETGFDSWTSYFLARAS